MVILINIEIENKPIKILEMSLFGLNVYVAHMTLIELKSDNNRQAVMALARNNYLVYLYKR